ncbi:class I SAM-dependent methyltransferase [Pseudolysinimonas sp.]|uniref:class I SAM-dependent methyltransferase n=1 Tax=Pseudolysinimonas sp. TaxID=2680009 RepID=UPI003F7F547E
MFEVDDDQAGSAAPWADRLAGVFLARLAPRPAMHALDVCAGTGALTEPLVDALGIDAVAAMASTPSEADALAARLPGLEVHPGDGRELPFPDHVFGLVAAQLVVHRMADPVANLREMARVAAPHGHVAATVWDLAGHRAPLSLFWEVAGELDPDLSDGSTLPGACRGALEQLLADAGMDHVEGGSLRVHLPYDDPEDWWCGHVLADPAAAAYVASLDPAAQGELRRHCVERLHDGPGAIEATAWLAVATV